MRILFALLLIANLALLAWQFVPAERGQAAPGEARVGSGQIRLLSEAPSEVRQARTRKPVVSASCYRLGPLDDPRVSDEVKASLEVQGYAVQAARQEQLEPLGYWVYLPPAPTLEAAQALGRQLSEKGVADYVFVVGAEKANAISLGLFPDSAAASARADQLRSLGFEPLVEQRYTRRVLTALEVKSEGAAPPAVEGGTWQPVDCQAGSD